MKTKFFSFITTLCTLTLYLSCASSPKYLAGYGSLDDQVDEAKRILDNARGFVISEEDVEQLIATLNYFPPLFAEQPTAPSETTQLSAYEREQKTIQYERDFKKWQDNNNDQIANAAKIRQASIKLLGQRPSLTSFEAISFMLFDPDPSVRNEALAVIKRANPLVAKIIYERAVSSELDESIRLILIQQLYDFGTDSEAYLIELLASDDETIASAAASSLVQRYPLYPNSQLMNLISSSSQADRYKSLQWLVLYQNRAALSELLTMASNESDAASSQRAQLLFGNYGRWVVDDLLIFLRQERYPSMHLLMIDKVAQFTDDRALPYLGELLASPDRNDYYRGLRYAKLYGARFITTAINLFNHPNPQVRLSAIEVVANYQDIAAVRAALPLITDPSSEVASAASRYIEASVGYSEAMLAQSFMTNSNSRLDYFLMQLLVKHGSPRLLYDEKGSLIFNHLSYLFTYTTANEWAGYVDQLKPSKRQIELQALYALYDSAVIYNKLAISYKNNPLVQEANSISLESILNSQRSFDDNRRFDRYLLDSPLIVAPPSQASQRKNFTEALSRWPTVVKASSASAKRDFSDYTTLNNNISKAYSAIKKEHQGFASELLGQYNISIATVNAFSRLNLRL